MIKKIFIVDDHPLVRRGLRQLFEREPDFTIVGEAEEVGSALDALPSLAPDLVVADLMLEGRGGLELCKHIQAHHPGVAVLVVSMHDELLYAERALRAGAQGYVMKRHPDDEILHAAREVLAGRIYVSDAVRQRRSNAKAPTAQVNAGSPVALLTDRELEVFLLIGEGYPPRIIADKLSLSVSTIEVYRERLKEKLGLESATLLLRYAVRWCKDNQPL